MGKMKTELVISTLKFGNEVEYDLGVIATKLLDSLLPDVDGVYSEEDLEVIASVEGCSSTDDSAGITVQELRSALFSMGRRKAPGCDGLTVEVLIRAWPHIKDHILEVMNAALDSGRFPRLWKVGLVKVLYKRGDKDPQLPKSYRTLTLLPVLCKVFEKILNRRILFQLESRGGGVAPKTVWF